MDLRILELKRRARDLAVSRAQSAFSLECAEELTYARDLFFDHPLLLRLQGDALGFLNEACGLGVEHGKRVAMDAAALILVEPSGLSADERRRLTVLAEMAGLLHDALRHEDNHAEKGADLCLRILRGYAISPEERLWIAGAVAAHEKDGTQPQEAGEHARLLAGAVHDADIFRYGPDIFATTLWELCECDEWSLEQIAAAFPEGVRRAKALAGSFHTESGRRYGPPLLAEGVSLSEEYERMLGQTLAANAKNKA
ncbi:MAG: HD domain-containing protein [Humidesulfovibrio sp.]|uniref:HD domain-containing protein n=1 Tax=Humidesulfovibrio sp. TaxID=2910988 RepID=UPI0027F4EC62|nr:HD domain-containing protein [Humidesulfovibrio sp.]MDQ7835668.1 HD domain-containing protein [Humidesulfovibrio sp.]